jgi:hypothetical protein
MLAVATAEAVAPTKLVARTSLETSTRQRPLLPPDGAT